MTFPFHEPGNQDRSLHAIGQSQGRVHREHIRATTLVDLNIVHQRAEDASYACWTSTTWDVPADVGAYQSPVGSLSSAHTIRSAAWPSLHPPSLASSPNPCFTPYFIPLSLSPLLLRSSAPLHPGWRLETAPTLAKSAFVDWYLTCEGRFRSCCRDFQSSGSVRKHLFHK